MPWDVRCSFSTKFHALRNRFHTKFYHHRIGVAINDFCICLVAIFHCVFQFHKLFGPLYHHTAKCCHTLQSNVEGTDCEHKDQHHYPLPWYVQYEATQPRKLLLSLDEMLPWQLHGLSPDVCHWHPFIPQSGDWHCKLKFLVSANDTMPGWCSK